MLAIVLRVCLALSVLLNGAGPAMATVHAQESPALGAAATAAAALPCHEAGDVGLAGSGHTPRLDMPATGVPAPTGQPSEDCCGGGPCECACVQPGQVPLPAVAGVAPLAVAPQEVRAMRSSHAAPSLQHLIRPPIG